jgi:predicted ABC-type ATPase
VQKGGHDVPVQKILDRRVRSLQQLRWFLEQADTAWLYDNSGAKPRLMGAKEGTTLTLEPDALPEIVDVIGRLRKESERLNK